MKCSHLSVPFFVSFLSPSVGKFFDVSGNICEVNKQIWRLLHINKENGNRRESNFKGLKTKVSKDTERRKKKRNSKIGEDVKGKGKKEKKNEVLKKSGVMRKERKVGRRILIPVVNLLSEILEPEVLPFSDIFSDFIIKAI